MIRFAHNSKSRVAAVLPIMVVLIVMVLSIAAISINSNWLLYHRINSQTTADLAAISTLVKVQTDTDEYIRINNAKDLGSEIYNLNYDREGQNINADGIELGFILDPSAEDPNFIQSEYSDSAISAVQIQRRDAASSKVPLFLSNLIGAEESTSVGADVIVGTKTVDVMLCLDASRSMNRLPTSNQFPPGASSLNEPPLPGSRWFELMETVEGFIESFRETNPNARLGLVTFGGGWPLQSWGISGLDQDMARLELPLTLVASSATDDINGILQSYASDHIALGRGTSIYDGISYSLNALDDHNATRHIILLSDGDPWQPGRPNTMVAAGDALADNVAIHTISFSGNFSILRKVAEETGGENFTAYSQEELQQAFTELLGAFRVQLTD